MDDMELRDRLSAIEARVPTTDAPALQTRRRLGRFGAPIAMAPALVLVMVASAAAAGVAGGVAVANLAVGIEGVENPGQPLAGAGLECMSPPEAEAYLAGRGYTDVIWQVETGTSGGKDGGSSQQATAPAHGFVVPGAILGDGRLIMVVDQRTGATGVGACFGQPMP